MSQYAPKISETHFQTRDFFDLVMRGSLSSASRAKAFLWLIWWYLESDFGYEDSQRNPFGAGLYGEGDKESGALPLKTPPLESLTEEQAALENVDDEVERHYGEVKRKERIAILASEPSPAMTALKRARKEKGLHVGPGGAPVSDDDMSESAWPRPPPIVGSRTTGYHETASDYTRSPSPVGRGGFSAVNAKPDMRINNLLNNDDVFVTASPPSSVPPQAAAPAPVKKGPGRGNWRRNKPKQETLPPGARTQDIPLQPTPLLPSMSNATPHQQTPNQTLSFVADGPPHMQHSTPSGGYSASLYNSALPYAGDHVPTPSYQAAKRTRGVTQHQSALISHRKQRIDYTLDRRIQTVHDAARRERERQGPILRAWKRIKLMPADYDSEEENIKSRKLRERAAVEEFTPAKGKLADGVDGGDAQPWRRPRVLMAGFAQGAQEQSDYGEEARDLARVFARCERRFERWEFSSLPGQAMIKRREVAARGLYGKRGSGSVNGKVGKTNGDGGGGGGVRRGAVVEQHVAPARGRRRREESGNAVRKATVEVAEESDVMDVDGSEEEEDDEDVMD